MMVSIWWVLCVFVLDGFAGLPLFAVMSTAAGQSERAMKADKVLGRTGLSAQNLEQHWTI